jgi:hypothetical protein
MKQRERIRWLVSVACFNFVLEAHCLSLDRSTVAGWGHPVWFPTSSPSSSSNSVLKKTKETSCVVFLHGRLEAESGEPPFPPPRQLYQQFCHSMADACGQSVLMVEYDQLLSTHLGKEPRNLRPGPISQFIFDTVEAELSPREPYHSDSIATEPISISLVTFSMGAAMGLKLLHRYQKRPQGENQSRFIPSIEKLVLIEPVWRCWLSLIPTSTPISETIPVLVIYGSDDEETLTDSGQNVQGSLQTILPNLTVQELKGGNHWYILNANLGEQALAPLKLSSSSSNETSAMSLRDQMIGYIQDFLEQ